MVPSSGCRDAPVEEIDVEPVRPEAAEARLAGAEHAFERGVVRQDLRDEEELVPSSGDRLPDELLDLPVAVHLRRVDVGHPGVDAGAEGGDRRGMVVALHVPGALAEHRDGVAVRAERMRDHAPRNAGARFSRNARTPSA